MLLQRRRSSVDCCRSLWILFENQFESNFCQRSDGEILRLGMIDAFVQSSKHRLFLLLLFLLRRWGIFENDDGQIHEHWDTNEFWVNSTFDISSGFLSGRIPTIPITIWSTSRTNNCRMIWKRFFLWRCSTVCDAFFSFVEHRSEWLDRRGVLVLIDERDCLRFNSFASETGPVQVQWVQVQILVLMKCTRYAVLGTILLSTVD